MCICIDEEAPQFFQKDFTVICSSPYSPLYLPIPIAFNPSPFSFSSFISLQCSFLSWRIPPSLLPLTSSLTSVGIWNETNLSKLTSTHERKSMTSVFWGLGYLIFIVYLSVDGCFHFLAVLNTEHNEPRGTNISSVVRYRVLCMYMYPIYVYA